MYRVWVGAAAMLMAGCDAPPAQTRPEPPPVAAAPAPAVGIHTQGGYVGSAACAECHASTHASWHRSYHRTMTQWPTPEAVRGRFDAVALDRAGRYVPRRRGDRFFVTAPREDGSVVESAVELVTGSHHMQVYWVRGDAGVLEAFAFAYLLPEQRWVPNEWTLLRPPADADALAGEPVDAVYTWNRVCVKCHAVDGVPGYDAAAGTVASTVAELGIACEACHGPGQVHVESWRGRQPDPEHALEDDPTMLDPREGGAAKASEVCGQCHSISVFHDDAAWVEHGRDAPPPDPLSSWGRVVRHPLREHGPWTDALLDTDPDFFSQRYWSDGEVRVSGREYNGLLESPCAASADFGCTTCHRMHEAEALVDGVPWVEGQPKEGARAGEICGRCHAAVAGDPVAHAKHSAASASCLDCHMPRTTYGLLGAIRSHTISSPSAETSLATGRPLACNLCHLDETLAWAADALQRDFAQAEPEEAMDACATEGCIPVAAQWLLAGDAGQRALVAWHVGRAKVVPPWAGPALQVLRDTDPYPAVRLIAARALARLGEGGTAPPWLDTVRARRDDREVRLAE